MTVNMFATALLAFICLLKAAFLWTSLTVIGFVSLDETNGAWEVAIIWGVGLGVEGAPEGLCRTGVLTGPLPDGSPG